MLAYFDPIMRIQFVGYNWNGNAHPALVDAMACLAVWQFLDKQEKATVTDGEQ